jgi:lysozyme
MNRLILFLLIFSASTSLRAQSRYVECEDTCSHIHGIDLSHYQGDVFWETVGESNMSYVYLKATEGGDRIDSKYQQNIDLAHRYGLKVGSYHFYRPRIPQQTQLQNFRAQCRPEDQDLLPMVDIETRSGLGKEEFIDSLFIFLRLMEKEYKQKPLIYTGANFYDHNLLGLLSDYKVMIAQYTQDEPVLKDDLDFVIWQYTGKGRLNGINGYVDKSRFMGKHRLREIRFRHR